MTAASPRAALPTTHPLINELTSLRQQLHQYQCSAHQSAIQLQGAKLELSLAREEVGKLKSSHEALQAEVETLRQVPFRLITGIH